MKDLFSMKGRINRQRYVLVNIGIVVIAFALAFVLGFVMGMTGGTEEAASAVGFIVGIGAAVVQAFLVVKRLHDLNKPGWHYWLLYVPFYNIYLGLVLLFTKGTAGSNQYGEDPAVA